MGGKHIAVAPQWYINSPRVLLEQINRDASRVLYPVGHIRESWTVFPRAIKRLTTVVISTADSYPSERVLDPVDHMVHCAGPPRIPTPISTEDCRCDEEEYRD